jgi:hypothetical protein
MGGRVLRRRAVLAHRHSVSIGNYVAGLYCPRVPFGLACIEAKEHGVYKRNLK